MTETGEYRTDDLALATVLALAGYEYKLVKLTAHKAIWVFSYSDEKQEDFDDVVGDYAEFCASVEPRAFVTRWGELRRELFALIPAPKRRRPVSPATAQ